MLHPHFLLLVMSLIGKGCGAMEMWGICSPISRPIHSPDKTSGTGTEEEEVSGFTAAYFLWSMGPCGQE